MFTYLLSSRQAERSGYSIPYTAGARETDVSHQWCQEAHTQLQPNQCSSATLWGQDRGGRRAGQGTASVTHNLLSASAKSIYNDVENAAHIQYNLQSADNKFKKVTH